MNLDVQTAIKPLQKLYKELKDFSAHPSPEDVHELRTHTRRLEAIVHTFSSDSDREAHRLLKLMKPVRKAAGKVRDTDVFMAKLHELPADSDTEGMALLTEHIAGRRERHLAHLHRAIARRRKEVCRAIRRYSHSLEAGNVLRGPAAPDILTAKLDNWPGLHAGNLHEFRICAKELRYMLQLVPETDRQRMNALAEVKDLAGDWHDWLELRSLAKEILDSAEDRQILRQMDAITRAKLHAGLNAANHLRRSSLEFPQAA